MATILVAEDNAAVRLAVRETLTRMGHDVLEAMNGQDAVKYYKVMVPDCVLMDIGLPVMDGLTALKQIREFDPFARVAMFTAYGMESMVEQAVSLGCVDFIVKPFIRRRLVAGVERMLAHTPPTAAEDSLSTDTATATPSA